MDDKQGKLSHTRINPTPKETVVITKCQQNWDVADEGRINLEEFSYDVHFPVSTEPRKCLANQKLSPLVKQV